ncbi:MFS general substrate transporter [Xylariomycetidae sp. FL2044]|nr:MFS general substrate transporter [Xylariomycetidae sp. FL2044]
MAGSVVLNLVLNAIGAGKLDPPPPQAAPTISRDTAEQTRDEALADPSTGADGAEKIAATAPVETGVSSIEAAQAIWGKHGRWLIIVGLCLIMIVYEIDNSTLYIYRNYAASDFDALAKLATLSTASTIVFAVAKPPIAKVSNVIGRGQTYGLTVALYVLSYVVMASARSFDAYAAGTVLYSLGQSGTNLMNDVVIADITTARWRAFGLGLSFWPFLVTPWAAGFVVESATAQGGIGWRWSIGILAFVMPFCASFIIVTLLYYQGRAKKIQSPAPSSGNGSGGGGGGVRMSLSEFCSQIDLGGTTLFCAGLALLLLPLTLAATTPARWTTPWLIVLIALGAVLLVAFPWYEHRLARHPFVPPRYFVDRTIGLCLMLGALDGVGFSVTHTCNDSNPPISETPDIYAWATVAKGLGARDATFFTYTNGVTQTLVAILAGLAMARTRRYKWLCVMGCAVRLVGYGVMLRLRGASNSTGEIFAQQLVQGVGSGLVGVTTLLVASQVVRPHAEMPQITALTVCIGFVGSSVGACVAGGIYTNTLEPALRRHLENSGIAASPETVSALANSINGIVPAWGTPERVAVSFAFSDVMQYFTYVAIGTSAVAFIGSLFLSNHELPERNNLVED